MQKSKAPKGSKPLIILKNKPYIQGLISKFATLSKKQLKGEYLALLSENIEIGFGFDAPIMQLLTYDQIRKRLAFAIWENNLNGAVCYCKGKEMYVKKQIAAICQFKDERAVYKIVRSFTIAQQQTNP